RLDISNTAPGAEVKFDIIREGKPKTINVKLGDLQDAGELAQRGGGGPGENPAAKKAEFLEGVQIGEITDEMRQALELPDDLKGALVRDVAPDSTAAEAGLQSGQVITMVNQQPIDSVKAAQEIRKGFDGEVLLLQVFTQGRRDILAVPVKK
ncbi:MAG: PDZ domain-containing protein, partial [Verrucomicrobiae bacterium]|nr:PDZ domain-containing protein [Verrucomicrobiae bacterium]